MARKATRSSVKLVFMLGLGDNYKDRITQENETYGDLIQENFVDAYSNNTFKTIMGFNWATQYCSEARLLVFLDDDYFVRWDKLVQFLYQSGKNHTDLFIGNLVRRAQPYRNVGSSWFVDPKVYPFRSYPPYLAGGAYVISYDVSKKIKMAFPYVRYIGVDDVYLGIVAQILSISPRHSTELSRRDHLSITKECSHTPSELLAARCQTVAYVSTGRVAKGFEYTIKNLTDVFTNMMMLIQKSLLFFQQIFTSGKH
ncbi:Beta-1,3-galactosyltransferase brn [Mizuhopecten yessoensis]|uniref:Hexosyltransferase n=2 Tax=Mizuhopecten yessoensis TaxID=6573 RepID=A0A210QK12_MIZYE|nr:Beta-1,3-galactosyltransferase brn [Mizuhopecten yessoensis]